MNVRTVALPLPLVALAAMVGCVTPAPSLRVDEIAPGSAWNGEVARVDVVGDGFLPQVTFDASSGAGDVDRAFRVSLARDGVDVAVLGQVALLDVGTLSATVPRGVAPGRYDVVVQSPDAERAVLPDGFVVKSTRAERLELTATEPASFWLVDQTATFDAAVYDGAGERLLEPLPVRLSVASIDGAPIVAGFPDGVLLDQVAERGASGASILGRLRLDGTAQVAVSVATPSSVLLRLEALEPDIDAAVEPMIWYPNADYQVTIDLPTPGFEATAGVGFVARVSLRDRAGRLVEDPAYPIRPTLVDACGDVALALPDLRGTIEVPVFLTRATGETGCATQQRLSVRFGTDGWSSEPFAVRAGPMSRFEVDVPGSEWAAGTVVQARVRPVDVFGNQTFYAGDPAILRVRDTADDVDRIGCVAQASEIVCEVEPRRAERGIVLVVRDPALGYIGTSRPYTVRAGPLRDLEVEVDRGGGPVEAGAAVEVRVDLYDAYGNRYDGPPVEPADFLVGDGVTFSCTVPAVDGAVLRSGCRLFRAGDAVVLPASGPGGAAGASEPFPVINGRLAKVTLETSDRDVEAGESFRLSVLGVDEWGNPYRVQDDPVLALSDTSGALSITSITLGAEGTAAADVSVTRSGVTFVTAAQKGTIYGASSSVVVRSGPATVLDVTPTRPWAWIDEPMRVFVVARDRYGNAAAAAGTATLSSDAGAFSATGLALVAGRGQVDVVPESVAASDTWRAAFDELSGVAEGIAVVEDCGTDGPDAALLVEGTTDAVRCHDEDGVSLEATLSDGAGVAGRFGLWRAGGGGTLSTAGSFDVDLAGIGEFELLGVAIDGTCAAEATARAWVAPDDGSPAGPIPVLLDGEALRVGQDTATVVIDGATTCDGAPADTQPVYLRVDRGELDETSSSGAGLYVTTDSDGVADATLDLTEAAMGGPAVVTAWVGHGGAAGALGFAATGDRQRPRVLAQHPEGAATGEFGKVVLTFSEPIDPASLDPQGASLTGPTTVRIVRLDLVAPDRVEAVLEAPINAGAGRWTFTLDVGPLDLAGNGMDGAWSGASSSYEGRFGSVSATAPAATSCAVDESVFRPDGDAGSGAESDEVRVTAKADAAPSTWRVQVEDAAGRSVRYARFSAASSEEGVYVWDGRDATGRVVADGSYNVAFTPHHADGTAGRACAATVRVDNRRGR